MGTKKNELLPNSLNKKFEEYKGTDSDKVDYWEARELMLLLGYTDWKNFKKVISKAQEACKNSKQTIENHFSEVGKMIIIARGTARETTRTIEDYRLSRYACYLIAQKSYLILLSKQALIISGNLIIMVILVFMGLLPKILK